MFGSKHSDAAFARRCRPTTFWRSFVVVVCFGAGFSVLGGALGSFIGQFLPDYYRAVFGIGRREAFDPVEVGIGLGLNQGWAVGLAVGLVVVGVFAWKDYWLDKVALAVAPHVVRRPERTSALLVLVIVLGILASVLSGFVGMILGSLEGYHSAMDSMEWRRGDAVRPILEHPDYTGIEVSGQSRGNTVLTGSVENQAIFDNLHERLVREFGTGYADGLMRGVQVKPIAEAPPKPEG